MYCSCRCANTKGSSSLVMGSVLQCGPNPVAPLALLLLPPTPPSPQGGGTLVTASLPAPLGGQLPWVTCSWASHYWEKCTHCRCSSGPTRPLLTCPWAMAWWCLLAAG